MNEQLDSNQAYWKIKIEQQKIRLRETVNWFPLPAFISFGLLLTFTGHLLMGLNPRLGNPAQIIEHDTTPGGEGSIWLSVSKDDQDLIFTTSDRKVFRYSLDESELSAKEGIKQHLSQALTEMMVGNILEKRVRESKTKVVLAVDQDLNYGNLRPVIRILADSGFNIFDFETRLSKKL